MEAATVAQKKDGEDGHQKQHPNLLRRFGRANADMLRQTRQVVPPAQQEGLDTFLGIHAPVMLGSESCGKLSDLTGELTGAGLIHKPGQRFSQAGALPGNPRADQKSDQSQPNQKQEVNNRDRPDTAADQLLQSLHRGINQVGKKNGKEEENQRPPRCIEEA